MVSGIGITQEVSNNEFSYNDFICFKNRIFNKSGNTIRNIKIEDISTYEFNNRYYDFFKSSKEIEVYISDGVVNISALKNEEYVIIEVKSSINEDVGKNEVKTYAVAKFEQSNRKMNIKSEENIIKLKKNNLECALLININKVIADINERINVEIEISNNFTESINNVVIVDLIPSNSKFINDSLYINNTYIKASEELANIKIGSLRPLQKVFIQFSIYISCEVEKLMYRANLVYEKESNINLLDKKEKSVSDLKVIKRRNPSLSIIKSMDKKIYTIGEIAHCNIEIYNNGNVDFFELQYKGIEELRCGSLISGSLRINGRSVDTKKNIGEGINIDYLALGDILKIEYNYKIDKVIDESIIDSVAYKYLGREDMVIKDKKLGDKCIYKVSFINLKCDISSNCNEEVFIGDEVINKIEITNKGNEKAKNVTINASMFEGMEFIRGSILINNIKSEYCDIRMLNVYEILSEEVITIEYKTLATGINNMSKKKELVINYDYEVEGRIISDEISIKVDSILISGAFINYDNIIKKISSKCIGIGEVVDVEISFINSGNLIAKRVFIKEILSDSLRFVTGSLIVNGVVGYFDIEDGFFFKDLEPFIENSIKYKLRAVLLGYNNIAVSNTRITYMADDRRELLINAISDKIMIKSAVIDSGIGLFVREINKTSAIYGEKIEFRIILRNSGNIEALNVVLSEVLDEGFKIGDYATVNGKEKEVIGSHINIGKVKVNEEIEVIYEVDVLEERSKQISSYSEVEYGYYKNESLDFISKKSVSNKVSLDVFNIKLSILESISKQKARLNEIIEYNLHIKNDSGVDIQNLNINLDIADGYHIDINEISINDRYIDKNDDLKIDFLKKDEVVIVNLKFEIIKINVNNNFNICTNIEGDYIHSAMNIRTFKKSTNGKVVIILYNPLIVKKSTTKKRYLKGAEVEYLVMLKNEGIYDIKNLTFNDTGMKKNLIEGSISINGELLNKIYISGIPIEKIGVGECLFIRYICCYDSSYKEAFCSSNISIKAEFFDADNKHNEIDFKSDDYIVDFDIIGLDIIKTSNKQVLRYNESVKFTTTIFNKGNVELCNINIIERNTEGFKLEKDSIYINGEKYSIRKDGSIEIALFKIGELYEVVTEYNYMNYKVGQYIESSTDVKYQYTDSQNLSEVQNLESNRVRMVADISTFKNLLIEHKVYNENKIDIAEVIDCILDIKITSSYLINTIENNIYKNNKQTGKKLIIRGYLDEKIEYVEDTINEKINILRHRENFSASIIVPKELGEYNDIRINTTVNEVFFKLLNNKTILNSISITVEALI